MIGVEVLKEKLKQIPHSPGVYHMLDECGKIIYIGKAKDLYARLYSYTLTTQLNPKTLLMVKKIRDLYVTEVSSEKDALILENQLIKTHQPFYNILLKDAKSFPYIAVSKEKIPRLFKYRGKILKDSSLYGPFVSGDSLNKTWAVCQKVFNIRTCRNSVFFNRSSPCLQYQIGLCSAPCVGYIDDDKYMEQVKKMSSFLNGDISVLKKNLIKKIKEASENLDYERALDFKNILQNYSDIEKTNIVRVIDADFIGIYAENGFYGVEVFIYRHGQNKGTYFYPVKSDKPSDEVLNEFMGQFYQIFTIPSKIFLSDSMMDEKLFEEAYQTSIQIPKRGEKKRIIDEVLHNAQTSLKRYLGQKSKQKRYLNELKDLLKLSRLETIAVFDNSHLFGTNAVGGVIWFNGDDFDKNKYRRYNIKNAPTDSDVDMMDEVMDRFLSRQEKPDLIILDGGRGQLSRISDIMEQKGLDIPVLAIAKGEKHDGGDETLYFQDKSIKLGKYSELLFFIERLRDEAHRFVITAHRRKRDKNFI